MNDTERLQAVLARYQEDLCEGFCRDCPPGYTDKDMELDCGGCKARAVLFDQHAATRQRHIDKIRAILGHPHNSTCKTSAFDRDDGPCDCGAEIKARQIVEYFERVASDG